MDKYINFITILRHYQMEPKALSPTLSIFAPSPRGNMYYINTLLYFFADIFLIFPYLYLTKDKVLFCVLQFYVCDIVLSL